MLSNIPAFENPFDELKYIERALDFIGECLAGHESRFEQLALRHQEMGKRLEALQDLADSFKVTPTHK